MNTRRACFRTLLTMSALLLVGCGSSGKSPDNALPVITLTGDNPQLIAVGEAYVELGATASDNRDGDLTASIVVNASAIDSSVPGTYQVSYNVSDAAGNAATTVIRTVTYEDRTPPVISLVGDDPLVLTIGTPFTDPGATASDNVDVDLSASVAIDASGVDTSTPGDYLVTYNVTDAAGNAATTVTRAVTVELTVPEVPTVSVTGDIKKLNFSWSEPEYVDYYRLMENPDGHSGFTQAGDDIPAGMLSATKQLAVHLHDWVNALYVIEACNVMGCSSSDAVTATDEMLDTIGYFKSSRNDRGRQFGSWIALSADGHTLAVAPFSDFVNIFRFDGTFWTQAEIIGRDNAGAVALSSNGNTLVVGAPSVDFSGAVYVYEFDGTQWLKKAHITQPNAMLGADEDYFGGAVAISADGNTLVVGAEDESSGGEWAGAAYVFRFDGTEWIPQAYLKASNTNAHDAFGKSVTLSADGNTLAVGAPNEESGATGNDGDQADNTANSSGAVYVFRLDGTDWFQQAYVKASNAEEFDRFGQSVSLSADGNTLAVGANEDSSTTVINGDQGDNAAGGAGAVYIFRFDDTDWLQRAYIKASNAEGLDRFGTSISLSADGNKLAVGASGEDSDVDGVNGDQSDNSATNAGAAYVFQFNDMGWSQQSYLKASNSEGSEPLNLVIQDNFGESISISGDGHILAVGAGNERSNATGINGDQHDNSLSLAGAVYVY